MKKASPPIPLFALRAAMTMMPSAMLRHGLDIVLRRMENRHPSLFRNLALLQPAMVTVEPTDLPHRFSLIIGGGEARLELLQPADSDTIPHCPNGHAVIRGSLAALLDMLEGRTDGDTLFFSRHLIISGDTGTIVGLRNTLDREDISLAEDFLSLLGPFSTPAAKILEKMHGLENMIRNDMIATLSPSSGGNHT